MNNKGDYVIYCPECGKVIKRKAAFCPGCGTKLKEYKTTAKTPAGKVKPQTI